MTIRRARGRIAADGDVMYLNALPLPLDVILLVILPTGLSMLGPVAVRRLVHLERLSTNNEVAGFKFATVGVLYAVLLAFTVVVVWENLSDAETDVAREAGAAATIYRLAKGLDAGVAGAIHEDLNAYLESAMTDEWRAMEHGTLSPVTTGMLDHLYATVLTYTPADRHGQVVLSALLHQLDLLTEARRARLVKASGIVPRIIWVVLVGGGFVTVGFTFFFGAENLRAQALMTGALALLIFAGLLVIVEVDHPFAGGVKVAPEAIALVLEGLGHAPGK